MEDFMRTQSINMSRVFVVIANHAKKGVYSVILPPPPSPQVSFISMLQRMKCYIARYSCFHRLLIYTCTFLKKKTVGEKLKELQGESAENEKKI